MQFGADCSQWMQGDQWEDGAGTGRVRQWEEGGQRESVWRVGQWCRERVSQCEEGEAVGHVVILFHPPN